MMKEVRERGEQMVHDVLKREFEAHRNFWIKLFLIFLLLALSWPFINEGGNALVTLVKSVSMAVFTMLTLFTIALFLIWRSLRGMAESLPDEARAYFLTGVTAGIMLWVRRVLLVFIGTTLLLLSF